MKNYLLYLFAFLLVIIFLLKFCSNENHPVVQDHTKQLRDSIKELHNIILFSKFREGKLHDSIAQKDKELQATEMDVIKAEARSSKYIASLQSAHQSKIDSLFKIFYPDSSKRAIVITHEEKEESDSMRNLLKKQIAIHQGIEKYQGEELDELKKVQIPAYQKIDSAHVKLEADLTNQLKRSKAKRFTVGPSLNLSLDGVVRPGISVGYALIKF